MKWLNAIICVLIFWSTWCSAADKKVLVIESYHPSLAWTRQCESAISKVLSGYGDIDYVYMDTKRIPESEFGAMANAAWGRYLDKGADLVMIGDDNGLKLLGPRFATTRTPVVFFGINNNPRDYVNPVPPSMTGLLERVLIMPWLRYLKEILPKSKSVLVLMDSSQTSLAIFKTNFNNKNRIALAGMDITCIQAENWETWQQTVLNSKSYQFLLFPTFHALKDRNGNYIDVVDVVKWTSAHSPIPMFTNQDYTVHDEGVVGAYVIQGSSHGRQAAEMAVDILTQKTTMPLPPPRTDREATFYFNRSQMERFKITLPVDIRKISVFQ